MKYNLIGNNNKIQFITEVLENRGIELGEIKKFLYPTIDCVNDSANLDNVNEGCALLKKHIDSHNKILIVVDSDCDGLTSAAEIYNFIYMIDKDATLSYALHSGKMHGLSNDLYVKNGESLTEFDLIILPDASSNDYEQHHFFKKHNTDILVIDHHTTPLGYSENAIVINNQLSKNYTNKAFSGAGVVWQFIRHYINKYQLNINCEYFLDLLTVGNIADVMDMRSMETKFLCGLGKENLNNAGIKALCKKQEFSMKGNFNPMSIGWYIGPLVNSVLRVGTMDEKILLFESLLDKNACVKIQSKKRGAKEGDMEFLVNEMARIASNVRNRQNKLVDKGMVLIEDLIKAQNLLNNKILLVELDSEAMEAEIVGLVANKIASKYKMPTLILRKNGDQLIGSGRNFENSPLKDFRDFLEKSGLMIFAQGHGSAFGASLNLSNKTLLIEYCNQQLKDITFEAIPAVDFIFDFNKSEDIELLRACCFELDRFKDVWGQGVHEPLIVCKNVNASNIQLMAKGTMKINCGNLSFMKFFSEKDYHNIVDNGKSIDIIGRVNVNEWNGRKTPQIFIDNYDFVQDSQVKKWIF